MDIAPPTAGNGTGPEQDRFGDPMPGRINEVCLLLQILTAYGRHIAALLNHPTLWRGFTTIARFFGTPDVSEIAARIQRGLMRAAALEALLRARAERGRDLVVLAPPAQGASQNPAQEKPPRPKPRQPPLAPEALPSEQDIRAEVRRRPIGRTIAAILLDLGVSPTLCAGVFWHRLFDAMQDYRGSLIVVFSEFRRREKQFDAEDWKRPNLPWPERTRQGAFQMLGFFIGQDPFPPAPAAVAGPS